jgi:hypothetical protein
MNDLKFAFRQLMKNPGFAAVTPCLLPGIAMTNDECPMTKETRSAELRAEARNPKHEDE